MNNPTFSQKFRYKFDDLMSKGLMAMIGFLGLISLLIIVLSGAIISFFQVTQDGGEPLSFIEGTWESLMRTLDSGTMGGDTGWAFRIIAFMVTLGGIFIISTFIGVLSSGIEGKLDELRKGKSFVIEKGHTLILGWSSKIFPIISELVIANENQKNPRIVILANKDKVEMEDEIRDRVGNLKNMKVICRSGNPNDLSSLSIVNLQKTKSIIILASEEENADPQTIKTILAITNSPERRAEPYHIIAEIKEQKNLDVAKMVGKDEVELLLTDDIIARIMVQTSRQSGLSIVYTDLMDFDGAEIYFNEEKELYEKTFGESLFEYEDSTVIGLQFSDGSVKMNPAMDYKIKKGDKIIAITEDDDTLIISKEKKYEITENAIVNAISEKPTAERILLLGWNNRGLTIIYEMDKYVGSGSYLKVVSAYSHDQQSVSEMAKKLKNITLEFQQADTTARDIIDNLDVTSYDSVQILCYKENMGLQEADAQTLISLLHLRRVCEEKNKDIKIVSEMLDVRNRDLAEVTKADDFIVSDKLISLLMSQVSENKSLMRVFEDLFDADGSEIYLKPIKNYVQPGVQTNFYTVLESAKRRNEIAIGYRIKAEIRDSSKAYGVKINPNKSTTIQFAPEDKIIVIAED